MTSVPVGRAATQFRDAWRSLAELAERVLFAIGWTTARTCRLLLTAVTATLFAAGWMSGRVVWPAMVWCITAVRVGWAAGRKPIGGRRGTD